MTLKEIQQKLKAPKGQKNTFGNYSYRSAEDILEAVKPMLGMSGLTLSDEVVQIGDRYYVKTTAQFLETVIDLETSKPEHSHIEVTAYAREELTKKGMSEAQITGSASSYARKYALNGLFLIDDTKDDDTRDNRKVSKPVAKKVGDKLSPPLESKPKVAVSKKKGATMGTVLKNYFAMCDQLDKNGKKFAEDLHNVKWADLNDKQILQAAKLVKDEMDTIKERIKYDGKLPETSAMKN